MQAGLNVGGGVDAPIGDIPQAVVNQITEELRRTDEASNWQSSVSGLNSGRSHSSSGKSRMRDGYAFIWKASPSKSKSILRHEDPVVEISIRDNVTILRQEQPDQFPGRRPGRLTFFVTAGEICVPVNIISWHAPTSVNTWDMSDISAGNAINKLASLREIGGGMYRGGKGEDNFVPRYTKLPEIDTILLGDFNYRFQDLKGEQKEAHSVYKNLLDNYEACVGGPDQIVKTTYAASYKNMKGVVSDYDKIFLLKDHSGESNDPFKASLKFIPSTPQSINFLSTFYEKIEPIGQGQNPPGNVFVDAYGVIFTSGGEVDLEGQQAGTGSEDAISEANENQLEDEIEQCPALWHQVRSEVYKKQYGCRGVSDHMPVVADFEICSGDNIAANACYTSGRDNNCLLHAMLGNLTDGVCADQNAEQNRSDIIEALRNLMAPNHAGWQTLRQPLLAAMISYFDPAYLDVNATVEERTLLWNMHNNGGGYPDEAQDSSNSSSNKKQKVSQPTFSNILNRYILGISGTTNRMLLFEEIALIATIFGRRVVVHGVGAEPEILNPTGTQEVHIYHKDIHFYRWVNG